MCAQGSTGVMALICKQHVDLKNKSLWEAVMQRLFNQGVRVLAVVKTLRYRNPKVDIMAAVKPIVIASHGWRTAGMETPTATPPARMHDCIWIWQGSEDIGFITEGRCAEWMVNGLHLYSWPLKALHPTTVSQHVSSPKSYQVEFSLRTWERRHGSCCYSTDSQGQVGAAHSPQLPPGSTILHKDWIKAGPKHPEKHGPWRTHNFLTHILLM